MNKFLPKKQGLYDPAFEKDSCGVGFICNVKGAASNAIVKNGIEILNRLSHRGAVGADPRTGDGAGILLQMPDSFLRRVCSKENIELPQTGDYGAGLIFLPSDTKKREDLKALFADVIRSEGQRLLGWRRVPVDNSVLGETAKESEPVFEQVFISRGDRTSRGMDFERKLYVIRRLVESRAGSGSQGNNKLFYITNISCRTLAYKGLLMPDQVESFFVDLKDTSLESAIALVHSRYSTNTFPTWDLAQPFRFLAHNGEINTLRGNINWMRARESLLSSQEFGDDLKKVIPVIVPGGSDSATIDNVFELLVLSGRSLAHALMMLIPGAWENNKSMKRGLKAFYKFHSCFMEPWDGPAAIAVTDGTRIGAVLDRNGLRPARYIVTKDDLVVMASEVGVLDIKPERIKYSGRLEPGKIFFIDTELKRIIGDSEIKSDIANEKPYEKWLKENIVDIKNVKAVKSDGRHSSDTASMLNVFGYTREDMKVIVKPMAEMGKEPIGSMGNDAPPAVLSAKNQLLFNYFKQLFAQVTNPAIDPIRESIVMSLESYLGPEKNILVETPEHCRKLYIDTPILTDDRLSRISGIDRSGFRSMTISTLFDVDEKGAFMKALRNICVESEKAIQNGYTFVILSDAGVNDKKAALPSLLATGAVHQYLVKKAMRARIGIVVESGEPREVHHFALLFGYGADCVNPYAAFEAIRFIKKEFGLDVSIKEGLANYIEAVEAGILKILSKMGISTLQSYRGAQIFEALGLDDEVIDIAFTGTVSRIGGAGLDTIALETIKRHNEAYSKTIGSPFLQTGGVYQWKKDGEFHLWNPVSISLIQDSTRKGDYGLYKEFASRINDQSANPTTLRSVLEFVKTDPIGLDQVEPASEIFKRFATGAMSFGSISKGAHETLAYAMNKLGGRSNTGEGGEDPARFHPLPNGDSARSAIKQVASGRFGVTTNYLINADELQIKISQGAKPGEGGQLPGHKVSEIIAKTRYTTPGVTLISPPPHHDIYSIEDLAQLIFDLKNVNPRARISVKLVSEIGVGTIAAGVAKGHADMILISGGDGGTGASPISSIKHAGLPWELGLSETHQTLVLNDLRSRVRLQTDGQMRTGRDVAIAACLGAEEYGFCTAALIVMGCVMLRHCHLNNCSVGVATQDDLLQKRFSGKVDNVINFFRFVAEDLRETMAGLGVRTMDELIGRTDLLKLNNNILPWKAKNLDASKILYRPQVSKNVGTRCTIKQDHNIDNILDRKLIELAGPAIEKAQEVRAELPIKNSDRTTGAMLSGKVCSSRGEEGLPDNTIHFKFKGEAGQSFGAWLAKGVTFELEGLANDYVGKGMSGGKIIIYPYKGVSYVAEENILIGNTTFYGAIAGEAYIRGLAGERFCIRNSGLYAVVEGVGDHGCEYMTGGRVVVLGPTGRNFGAGMSGGIAYVFDTDGKFAGRCNMEMVELEKPAADDREVIYNLVHNHYKSTGSTVAKRVLDDFQALAGKFIKVMPLEYKRILASMQASKDKAMAEVSDG